MRIKGESVKMAAKNKSIVDEWLTDDNLMLLEAWARDGYTESQIAECVGVYPSTINYWKKNYKPIRDALKTGKEIIDYKVENALLKAALGFKTTDIKVTIGRQVKDGKIYNLTKETIIKEVPPNVTACAMWLNNRKPDKWKRNRDKIVELEEDNTIQITVIRGNKEDEEGNINQSVKLQKNTKNIPDNESVKNQPLKKDNSLKFNDRDYWPDDWKED